MVENRLTPLTVKPIFFRERLGPSVAKTGNCLLTDKKRGACVRYNGEQGQGQFFQFDGEGRFAFNPDGEEWKMDIRNVLKVPMVVSPKFFKKHPKLKEQEVKFEIPGTDEEKVRVKARLMKWVSGGLVAELNATEEDCRKAGLPLDGGDKSDS